MLALLTGCWRAVTRRGDRGSATLEYIGALLVCGVVCTLVVAAVPDVRPPVTRAVCLVLQEDNCGSLDSLQNVAAQPHAKHASCTSYHVCVDSDPGTLTPAATGNGSRCLTLSNNQIVCNLPAQICDSFQGHQSCRPVTAVTPDALVPRAAPGDSCASANAGNNRNPYVSKKVVKGDGPVNWQGGSGSGSGSGSGNRRPVWNVNWTFNEASPRAQPAWQRMIAEVRRAAARSRVDPVTTSDATAVGTVTVHLSSGPVVTLYLQAQNLYLIGWQTTATNGTPGPTHSLQETSENAGIDLARLLCPDAQPISVGSSYSQLEGAANIGYVENPNVTPPGTTARRVISTAALQNAFQTLSRYDPTRSGSTDTAVARALLTLATAVPESARLYPVQQDVDQQLRGSARATPLSDRDIELINNWGALSNLAQNDRAAPVRLPLWHVVVFTMAAARAYLALINSRTSR